MYMKVFLYKCLLGCSAAIALLYMINCFYTKTYKVDNGTEKFKDLPSEFDICNVGSSHGELSFDYSAYEDDYSCANLGLSSQSYEYDLRIMQYYSDRLHEGTIVFIPYSFFSLMGPRETDREGFLSHNKYYYSFLPREYIMEYDFVTDLVVAFPALDAQEKMLDAVKDYFWGDGKGISYGEEINMEDNAKEFVTANVLKYQTNNSLPICKEQYDALIEMIELCETKGARPILITTPTVDIVTDMMNELAPEFLEEFHETAIRISKKMNIEYYDYLRCEEVSDNYDYYIDAHHLNAEGAKKFTEIVFNRVFLVEN